MGARAGGGSSGVQAPRMAPAPMAGTAELDDQGHWPLSIPCHQDGCLRNRGVPRNRGVCGIPPRSHRPTASPATATSPMGNPVTWGPKNSSFQESLAA